jgi:hypothetical protein
MKFFRRFLKWCRNVWRRRRPLAEPDLARLNFLGSGYRLSVGELDMVPDAEVLARLIDMRDLDARHAIVVTLTRERGEQWFVHKLMVTFGPPVSALSLADGRRCFVTWAAG